MILWSIYIDALSVSCAEDYVLFRSCHNRVMALSARQLLPFSRRSSRAQIPMLCMSSERRLAKRRNLVVGIARMLAVPLAQRRSSCSVGLVFVAQAAAGECSGMVNNNATDAKNVRPAAVFLQNLKYARSTAARSCVQCNNHGTLDRKPHRGTGLGTFGARCGCCAGSCNTSREIRRGKCRAIREAHQIRSYCRSTFVW